MEKAVLIIAPAPVFPTSAGNRRRELTVCEAFMERGYEVDFAYFAHEDEIYRMFGQHAPTDLAAMNEKFRNVFYIEPNQIIRVKTKSRYFYLDDWYSLQIDDFILWYFRNFPDTSVAVVNYVFLSAAFLQMPPNVIKILETHDRFFDRQRMYNLYRGEPNFFYLDKESEARGLSRSDMIVAIQDSEQQYFSSVIDKPVYLLPHKTHHTQLAPGHSHRVHAIGFIGHGNDPNLVSISRFAHAWSAHFRQTGGPTLRVAGEVCRSFEDANLPGVVFLGYCKSLSDFYESVDIVVAPLVMGTGLKIKTVEALSYGKPVIGTSLAFEGLSCSHDAHQCATIDDVVAAVAKYSANLTAIANLAEESVKVYERYVERSKTLEDEFFHDLDKLCVDRRSDLPAHGTTSSNSSPEQLKCFFKSFDGGAIAWRENSCDSIDVEVRRIFVDEHGAESTVNGRLLATERKIGASCTHNDILANIFSPFRERWFLGVLETNTKNDPTTAKRVSRPLKSIDAFGPKANVALSPNLVRTLDEARLASEDRDRLLATLIGGAPDWTAPATAINIGNYTISIATLGSSGLFRFEDPVYGVASGIADADGFEAKMPTCVRLELTKKWALGSATPLSKSSVPYIRQGSGLTIIPVGLTFLATRPLFPHITEIRIVFRGRIGAFILNGVAQPERTTP